MERRVVLNGHSTSQIHYSLNGSTSLHRYYAQVQTILLSCQVMQLPTAVRPVVILKDILKHSQIFIETLHLHFQRESTAQNQNLKTSIFQALKTVSAEWHSLIMLWHRRNPLKNGQNILSTN